MRILVAAIMLGVLAVPAIADAAGLPRDAIEKLFETTDCPLPIEEAVGSQQSFDLGDGKTLYLVNCWRAAYQNGRIALVTENAGAARLLTFKSWNGKRFISLESPTEPEFDPASKTLSSYHKGRGLGDCGSLAEWRWNGSEFKLTKYFYKEKCDGRDFSGGRRWQIFPRRR